MRHLDVFLNKEVAPLIDAFAACFSVKVTLFSADMEELAVGLQNPGSQYCRHIQTTLHMLQNCKANDRKMCQYVSLHKCSMTYHCHAGLQESIIPINIEGTVIGNLVVGQFRDSSKPPDHIAAIWNDKCGAQEGAMAAYNALPCFSAEMLENMLRLATMLVHYIASRNYVSVRRGILIERIQRYIDEHIDIPILLSEAAQELDYSESSVSHTVKKELGISFSRLASLRKIERFEMLIVRDPNLSIREASSQIGYQDQFYFSRLYKKLRGFAPSAYLSAIRKDLV
jgi:AraC-like DNA-binding protein